MNKTLQSIAVSSQKGGAGKTAIAVNLATSLSTKGFRILLIDGDCLDPSIGFHLCLEQMNMDPGRDEEIGA
jgi:Mrp family chromosome partitioning ATPase